MRVAPFQMAMCGQECVHAGRVQEADFGEVNCHRTVIELHEVLRELRGGGDVHRSGDGDEMACPSSWVAVSDNPVSRIRHRPR